MHSINSIISIVISACQPKRTVTSVTRVTLATNSFILLIVKSLRGHFYRKTLQEKLFCPFLPHGFQCSEAEPTNCHSFPRARNPYEDQCALRVSF